MRRTTTHQWQSLRPSHPGQFLLGSGTGRSHSGFVGPMQPEADLERECTIEGRTIQCELKPKLHGGTGPDALSPRAIGFVAGMLVLLGMVGLLVATL